MIDSTCSTISAAAARFSDWEEGTPRTVAQFRAAVAEHIGEPSWKGLVKRLRQESPEFAELGNQHEVQPMRNLTKRFLHPDAGLLAFEYTHLWFGRRSEIRLTTYVPADSETASKLAAR
ncbi:hypothetical protein HNR02_001671 [Amycolatopsis endophytica]|uniref:MmyB-like transcription regulator ligand binding domain-containing protein n=1 Tax=Amycolatopsis endophytica TaxID=860233 RepID=A0A853AZZ7_9PSEU|nr:hypothetical protein [Amycolatopsis endophytica]NYI88348.1 hypothetical protein [Amycolatopsis endophytica]